jgi:tryptophan synthase alpha chain
MSGRTGNSLLRVSRPIWFSGRPPGEPGLAVFLNAGDPPLDALPDVVRMLDQSRVDCLELAVPFPDSVTDGPLVRRSARRALHNGVELRHVLRFVAAVRPSLRHLRIALLADWSHTVRPAPVADFLSRVHDCGADAVLLHALPPRLAPDYHVAARRIGLPVVATCYATSADRVRESAARSASAFVYLAAGYGRTGTPPPSGFAGLTGVIRELHEHTGAPVAVGFGVRTRADVVTVHEAGADSVIVGSAAVARVEHALATTRDVVVELRRLLHELRPTP